jgi:hypothetical protein
MALFQTATTSFKVELLQAVHNFGPTSANTFKIALYTGNASLGPTTTVYTTGGIVLTISQTPTSGINNQKVPTAYISFSPAVWAGATFIARGALIYNQTQANKSVAVLDFGSDKVVNNQTFTITFPADTANDAIVRIS